MRKFLIASHGRLASGIASSCQILTGSTENITVIDAYLDESRIEPKIEAFFNALNPEDQAIMMSDLYGGSVNQVMARVLADHPDAFLITGINLALVLQLILDKESVLTKEQLLEVISMSREAMQLVEWENEEAPQAAADDFF